ncbi:MAG: nuclease-related domain-containing protein [Bacillota bacterium]|nr:nuclease-related domain-containing protein [Bacillota bacterium]
MTTNTKLTTVKQIEEKINLCENDIELLNNQKSFPFVYVMVAFPTTLFFIFASILSEGIVTIYSAVVGGLFFSLLISSLYIVAFQPNKEELEEELKRELKYLWRLKAKLEAGKKGEMEIAYYLKWLNNSYIVFNDISLLSSKFGIQQIDHLVVGPNGIFHIETKNINATIKISSSGDWVLEKHLRNQILTEGMESPHHQIKRHEVVVKELLNNNFNKNVHIEGLVAMANSRTIIEGVDPVLEVVKKDKLVYHIENGGKKNNLSPADVKQVALIITKNCVVDDDNKSEEVVE